MILQIPEKPTYLNYLLSGAFIGLATSTKYPAVMMILPLCIAHLLRLIVERIPPWKARGLTQVFISGIAVILFFSLTSPFVVLDLQHFIEDWKFQMPFLRDGIGVQMDYGWKWVVWAINLAAGRIIVIAAFIEVLRTLYRAPRNLKVESKNLILLVFVLATIFPLIRSRRIFFRYILPTMPVFCLFAARTVDNLSKNIREIGLKYSYCAALLLLCTFDPGLRGFQLSKLLSKKDSRVITEEWILKNIPKGSSIATQTTYYYGRPLPPPKSYRYVDYNLLVESAGQIDLSPGRVEWLMVDESPVSFFSPGLRVDQQQFVDQNMEQVFVIDPFVEGKREITRFDPEDAFYAPLAGFGGMKMPGTKITIYRLKQIIDRRSG